MSKKAIIFYFGIIFILISCHLKHNNKVSNLAPDAHQVIAEEVIQGTSYTYVRASADGKDYWVAINKSDIMEGGTYFWSKGMAMKNFTSKELNRTFDNLYLVQDFTDQPITADNNSMSPSSPPGTQPIPQKKGVNVKPAEDGISIADLYAQKSDYEGKPVKIRGEVVKFSSGIMNKNWIHIQDGTQDDNNYDLAVTSQDFVSVGDIAEFEGVISLNRDFGAGYFYDVIMEDARLIKSDN